MTLRLARAIATFFFVGFFPLGPGTVSAAVALALWLVIPPAALVPTLLLWGALIAAGIWASGRVEEAYGHDSPRVVIDEVAGALLTVAGFAPSAGIALAGFALFRFFDIVKPPPIYQMQSYPGGWGVMADDLAAGVAGNLCLRLLGLVAPGAFAALAGFGGQP